jgi:hypothetical protein
MAFSWGLGLTGVQPLTSLPIWCSTGWPVHCPQPGQHHHIIRLQYDHTTDCGPDT